MSIFLIQESPYPLKFDKLRFYDNLNDAFQDYKKTEKDLSNYPPIPALYFESREMAQAYVDCLETEFKTVKIRIRDTLLADYGAPKISEYRHPEVRCFCVELKFPGVVVWEIESGKTVKRGTGEVYYLTSRGFLDGDQVLDIIDPILQEFVKYDIGQEDRFDPDVTLYGKKRNLGILDKYR